MINSNLYKIVLLRNVENKVWGCIILPGYLCTLPTESLLCYLYNWQVSMFINICPGGKSQWSYAITRGPVCCVWFSDMRMMMWVSCVTITASVLAETWCHWIIFNPTFHTIHLPNNACQMDSLARASSTHCQKMDPHNHVQLTWSYNHSIHRRGRLWLPWLQHMGIWKHITLQWCKVILLNS